MLKSFRCQWCGSERRRDDSKFDLKYCSNYCQGMARSEPKYQAWLSGIRPKMSPGILRRYVIRRDGDVCSVCGLGEWRGLPIPLEVHHLDGNGSNSVPSNVTLMCPNCHAQTDTFRSKNRGNGRFARAERYRAGASY